MVRGELRGNEREGLERTSIDAESPLKWEVEEIEDKERPLKAVKRLKLAAEATAIVAEEREKS